MASPPEIDDGAILFVLEKLLTLDGQRLSYRALDVEQIGSVYEGLMGYRVLRLEHDAVRIGKYGTWVTAEEIARVEPSLRAKWIEEETGTTKLVAKKMIDGLPSATGPKSSRPARPAAARPSPPAEASPIQKRTRLPRFVNLLLVMLSPDRSRPLL